MTRVAVGIGSNLGDRLSFMRQGWSALAGLGSDVVASSLYETDPVGGPEQGRYLNAVVALDTELAPLDLLAECQRIEHEAGRERQRRWDARTLDLDIICYGDETIHLPTLDVPHPRAAERRFVLAPLAEVWPEAPVGGGTTASETLARLDGQPVFRFDGDWVEGRPSLGTRSARWVIAQFVLLTVFAAVVVATGTVPDGGWRWILGGLLLVGAAALGVSAVGVLGRELTPYPQPRVGAELVDRGPYRWVRHPIYGAIVLGLSGLVIWSGSWPGGGIAALIAAFFWAKSGQEERILGVVVPDYADFRNRVRRRLIPGLL